jgi:hypothetical protein
MGELDYLGVRPCGCMTAWMSGDHVTKAEVRDFYRSMADTGREVRRMSLDDAKASGNFLPLSAGPHCATAPGDQLELDAAAARGR